MMVFLQAGVLEANPVIACFEKLFAIVTRKMLDGKHQKNLMMCFCFASICLL